jgi:hypothetical protein
MSHTFGTLTGLANGKVLLAGGIGEGGVDSDCIASPELYSPATGTWTATGNMTSPRCDHTAVLLSNGQVLVAGGFNASSNSFTSAELYNPSTGAWQATGSLNIGRQLAGAVTVANGKVLIASGADVVNGSSTELTSAEIYDPLQGRFSSTTSLSKFGSDLVLLANGDVLDVGVAFYTPAMATWTSTGTYPPAGVLNGDRAALLGTGNVLITGFVDSYSGSGHPPLATAALYEFSANKYALTGSMTTPRLQQTMTLLSNGQVLVVGGFNRLNNTANTLSSAELYTP